MVDPFSCSRARFNRSLSVPIVLVSERNLSCTETRSIFQIINTMEWLRINLAISNKFFTWCLHFLFFLKYKLSKNDRSSIYLVLVRWLFGRNSENFENSLKTKFITNYRIILKSSHKWHTTSKFCWCFHFILSNFVWNITETSLVINQNSFCNIIPCILFT